ncbi:TonB-dependent receptor plug domain-containing protein [Steroidobacter cummioxidans]|uniref:TonB-dependent receptor plug domain-containing protein n=1 Tax=Steroidobacter cummioxidans TaxID=1803913 RepID=UPI000E318408|nr:TonB-dependent receptor [Steroidobacter cummioxidans]
MPYNNVFESNRLTVTPDSWPGFKAPTIGATALLAAMALMAPQFSYAQDAADQSTPSSSLEQIVVTGSRIGRVDGFEAPTPVTVMGEAELRSFASPNIADSINSMPVFAGSMTPGSSVANVSGGHAGMNVLNLRSLGRSRTLVLLDGQRIVASNIDGSVDVNNIPQDLVSRVEVVTGGASAVYGSDAVGGVVNFILDTTFTGLKGRVTGGMTGKRDNENVSASLTGGTSFASGRGHIVANVSGRDSKAVRVNRRDWNLEGWQFMYNPNYTPTNGQPERLMLNQVSTSDGIRGGIITNTPLRGTAFGPGGAPYQFRYGDLVSDPDMRGGDWYKTQVRGTEDGLSLAPDITDVSVFAHATYQLTDNIEVFAQASHGRSETYNYGYTLECNSCLTISADNPFIPASVQTQMQTLGLTEFEMGTQHQDLGSASTDAERAVSRYVVGAKGDFELFGTDWNWDVSYQKGIAKLDVVADNSMLMANFNRAVDAVRHPVTGEIVCRSSIADPGNGCVAYNPMGIGVNSQATLDYIRGAGLRQYKNEEIKQDAASATIAGEPFSIWAGPVSIAAGLAYRKDTSGGSNDPISDTRGWYTGGYGTTRASIDVTEGFIETVVPLARNVSWADQLEFNGAVRLADYSTSGSLTTWKAGLVYKPVDALTFRATRSRDARAPNIAELYSIGGGGLSSATNPFTGLPLILIPAPRTGNPNLTPELADGLGLGLVLQPSFLPGFSLSVDYWSVKLKDSIATLVLQEILDRCYQGSQQYCTAITFAPGSLDITEVARSPFNYVVERARGIDFEASYRTSLGAGNLSTRLLVARYIERSTDDGITPRNLVGQGTGSDPQRLRWNFKVSYALDPVSVGFTARGVSSSVYDNRFIECTMACPPSTSAHRTVSTNKINGQIVFDTSLGYDLDAGGAKMNLFLDVRNILDEDPPVVANGPGADGYFYSPANYALHDYMGRVFQAGVRIDF